MARLPHPLTRWLKLLLACFALATVTPAQAMTRSQPVESVAVVQGGPARQPARPAVRRSPPAWTAASFAPRPRALEHDAHPASPPLARRERLFLLHRALLR